MSARFAKLAVDASSFYNVPVADALEKIRAGLTGESEPLKAFGVIMDETTMKAEAVRMGLARKGQELDNAAKLAARAALIEKGLAAASGDMARTQDGAANQARKFWGTLQNLGDTIGTVLLPSFTRLVGLLNEVASAFSAGAEAGPGKWASAMEGVNAAIDAAGVVFRNFEDIVDRTGVMIAGKLLNAWEVLGYGGQVAKAVGAFIWGELVNAFHIVLKASENLQDNLISIFQEIWEYVKSGFKDPIEFHLKGIMDGIKVEGDGEVKMPKLRLSSVQDQLDEIDERMRQREEERIAKSAAPKPGAARGRRGRCRPGCRRGNGFGDASKVGVTDADTFARDLQDAALHAAPNKKVEDNTERTARAVEQARVDLAKKGEVRGILAPVKAAPDQVWQAIGGGAVGSA